MNHEECLGEEPILAITLEGSLHYDEELDIVSREFNIVDREPIVENLLTMNHFPSHWQTELNRIEWPVRVPHIEGKVRPGLAVLLTIGLYSVTFLRHSTDSKFINLRKQIVLFRLAIVMMVDDRQLSADDLQVGVEEGFDLSILDLVLPLLVLFFRIQQLL